MKIIIVKRGESVQKALEGQNPITEKPWEILDVLPKKHELVEREYMGSDILLWFQEVGLLEFFQVPVYGSERELRWAYPERKGSNPNPWIRDHADVSEHPRILVCQ